MERIIKVTERTRKLKNGRISHYLDFYPPIKHPETGKDTRRFFLNIHTLDKPKSTTDQVENSHLIKLKSAKVHEIRTMILNNDYSFFISDSETENTKTVLSLLEKYKNEKQGNTLRNWQSTMNHFKQFLQSDIQVNELTPKVCNDFKEHLNNATSKSGKQLHQNSKVQYLKTFKAFLNVLFEKKHIDKKLSDEVKNFRAEKTKRAYLTLDEVNQLIKTPCSDAKLKNVFLFSILTGLRISDIEKLCWLDVDESNKESVYIRHTQQKTKELANLPISAQARNLMGKRGADNESVFNYEYYSGKTNEILREWIKDAGIDKYITFHDARHTNAVLLISKGVDVFTVQKLLGHTDIATTMIYADVLNEAKIKASNKINLDFD